MECWLEHGYAIILEHMKQCRLARIVQAKEEQFGMLIRETEGREKVPDWEKTVSVYSSLDV